MGFRSERAQKCAKLCSDNHKSLAVKLFYHGTMNELLVPYVRQAIVADETPTAQGYVSWCKGCSDPNYL